MTVKSIHPFPARMAPEVALRAVSELPARSLVLDPMAGSGTVLRAAADRGHSAIGFDLDPLAVLMARVWNTEIDPSRFLKAGYAICDRYDAFDHRRSVSLPWIDADLETKHFIRDWFGRKQRMQLRLLSSLLRGKRGPIADAMRIALSRTIIRKEGGASLGDDISHSRPHIVREENDYDVAYGFERSLLRLASIFEEQPPQGRVRVRQGDTRSLCQLRPKSVDAIVTSPPYLNAIDYLRGHRLSLVWFGYQMRTLRRIRAISIGAEHGGDFPGHSLVRRVRNKMGNIDDLPSAQKRMVDRYIMDLRAMLSESRRVLKTGGTALFVMGDSCLRGVFIRNSEALAELAEELGFLLTDHNERELTAIRRYLPPPSAATTTGIDNRMRTEVVMRFQVAS